MGLTRNDLFPSRYLSKEDVPTPICAVIADVRLETITGDGGAEEKGVLLFGEKGLKPMVLNATNGDLLLETYGPDTDGWIDKAVEIYIDPGVMYAGRRVGGLRLRIPAGTPIQAAATPRKAVAATLTFQQAVSAAELAGMTKAALVEALKLAGCAGYNAARDTALVQQIIREHQSVHGAEAKDDEIPF